MKTPTVSPINWPEPYLPAKAAVFVHNEIVIPACAKDVWSWVIRAELWPDWYTNAADMHFLSHAGPDLRDRSRFRWRTFGARMTSKVLEFEPERRIAWDAQGHGIDAYHAWVLTPLADGSTEVVSEETQNGWRARLDKWLMPKSRPAMNQLWLESLSVQAQTGPTGEKRGEPGMVH